MFDRAKIQILNNINQLLLDFRDEMQELSERIMGMMAESETDLTFLTAKIKYLGGPNLNGLDNPII
jgi:hypothetical protein